MCKVASRLAETARTEGWDHETYLAAVLAEEVGARDSHGGEARVKAARFPAVKTIDDFDFTVQSSVERATIAHLAQLDFLAEAVNVGVILRRWSDLAKVDDQTSIALWLMNPSCYISLVPAGAYERASRRVDRRRRSGSEEALHA